MGRAVEVVVVGRVQGVGYRAHAEREARRLGLTGWVRNEPDGSVALRAEGPDGDVEELLTSLRSGPPSASVERVDVTEAEPGGASSFEVRA